MPKERPHKASTKTVLQGLRLSWARLTGLATHLSAAGTRPCLRPSGLRSPAFSSYSIFHPCWGFSFSGDSIHFVLLNAAQFLLLPWLFHPDPWPALKPTAQATGAVTDLLTAAPARLTSPHGPRDPLLSPACCACGLGGEAYTRVSGVCVAAAGDRRPHSNTT